MPNISAAAKALRQTKKRTAHHKKVKAGVEIAIRRARKAMVAKSSEAVMLVNNAVKLLDRARQKSVIKMNTAARLKSRLMKALHKSVKK
jgi:small subunit ribosomal protein S20